MLKAVRKSPLFSRKKSRPFKEFHAEWIETLKTTLLPLLRASLTSSSPPSTFLLPTHVEMIHHHLQSYYETLDLAASHHDVAQFLFPDWRNSLEIPFLWLGDLHPYLFTNLLRSFLDDGDDEEEEADFQIGEGFDLLGKPWNVVMAWKSPSKALMTKIEQIECGLRLMVPAISARLRNAQKVFVERVGGDWGRCEGRREVARGAVGEALAAEMDEMTGVFLDANRLRRSVLADIMSATTVYQAALFLEGLSQFLVGFRDHEVIGQFKRCKTTLDS